MPRKMVVFIMGPGHCGSTLLDLILGSHSNAFSLGEICSLQRLLEKTSGKSDAQLCDICVDSCEFWNQRANIPILQLFYSKKYKYQRIAARIARFIIPPYRLFFSWTGKSMLIDSSKSPGWIKRQLEAKMAWFGIEPYLIYMCRDGRAVVNSYLRKYPERGMKKTIDTWMQQINLMNGYYERFPHDHRLEVQYELLATKPEAVTKNICKFLNIEYEPEMLRYWMHKHHIIRGNAGTRSLIYKHRMMFQDQEANLLTRDESERKYYDGRYYEQVGLAIDLDQRWTRELTSDQLHEFEAIAGDVNKRFAYDAAIDCLKNIP